MKLFSKLAELRALYSICNSEQKVRSAFLTKVSSEHFHYLPVKTAFDRFSSVLKNKGEHIDYDTLVSDPILSEDIREVLIQLSQKDNACSTVQQAIMMVNTLESYRKARVAYFATSEFIENLDKGAVDIDSLLDKLSVSIDKARVSSNSDTWVNTIGKGNNTLSLIDAILNRKDSKLIPTGIQGFDSENIGLALGSLLIIAANTGGGKSVIANQLCLNIFKQKLSANLISLEMDAEESMHRTLANLCDIKHSSFVKNTLTVSEKKKAKKEYLAYAKFGKENGCRYTLITPDEDITFSSVISLSSCKGYTLIALDYAALLKDADSPEQWKVLARIARQAKMFAKKEKCIFCLVMQLNEEDKLAFSKAVGHHADNIWWWRMTDESKESGIIEVHQSKARNQKTYSFPVLFEFEYSRIKDVDIRELESGSDSRRLKAGKTIQVMNDSDDYFDNISGEV